MIVATLLGVVALPVLYQSAVELRAPAALAAVATSNSNEENDNNGNNNSNGNDNGNNNNGNGNGNSNGNSNSNGNGNSNSNGNGNGNSNGNGNGNGNGNDNIECFPNLNSNDNVPCNFNGNGNFHPRPRPQGSVTGTTKCFDIQEVGLVQRGFGDGDVTASVPPDAGFSAITRISLHSLDPASVPPPPAGTTLVDSLVWTIDAQAGCDGPAIVSLPGGMNLGITYRIPSVDKSKVQIVSLQGGSWQNVTTVPDPNPTNPYVSASITSAGTFALVQKQ